MFSYRGDCGKVIRDGCGHSLSDDLEIPLHLPIRDRVEPYRHSIRGSPRNDRRIVAEPVARELRFAEYARGLDQRRAHAGCVRPWLVPWIGFAVSFILRSTPSNAARTAARRDRGSYRRLGTGLERVTFGGLPAQARRSIVEGPRGLDRRQKPSTNRL